MSTKVTKRKPKVAERNATVNLGTADFSVNGNSSAGADNASDAGSDTERKSIVKKGRLATVVNRNPEIRSRLLAVIDMLDVDPDEANSEKILRSNATKALKHLRELVDML